MVTTHSPYKDLFSIHSIKDTSITSYPWTSPIPTHPFQTIESTSESPRPPHPSKPTQYNLAEPYPHIQKQNQVPGQTTKSKKIKRKEKKESPPPLPIPKTNPMTRIRPLHRSRITSPTHTEQRSSASTLCPAPTTLVQLWNWMEIG